MLDEPKLIIFDCDGVLIDSEMISATTLVTLIARLGITIDIPYVQEHFLGRSFPTVAASIRKRFDVELPANFESEYRRQLLSAFEHQLTTTDGLEVILDGLSIPACVATSSSPERAARSLEIVGLQHRFANHVYTASEVKTGKPAPDLFLHVAKCEAVQPKDCLVIEDSVPGLRAARSAHMNVLRYTGGSHLKHMQHAGPDVDLDIPTLDSWARFFDIVPALRMKSHRRRK